MSKPEDAVAVVVESPNSRRAMAANGQWLLLQNANVEDAGRYRCIGPTFETDFLVVFYAANVVHRISVHPKQQVTKQISH